ncbi:hypothetical protein CHU98_g2965 [Xylaria longipes]|nr:hypothetical protein CHU98_g2965 [Xylaria longipes]
MYRGFVHVERYSIVTSCHYRVEPIGLVPDRQNANPSSRCNAAQFWYACVNRPFDRIWEIVYREIPMVRQRGTDLELLEHAVNSQPTEGAGVLKEFGNATQISGFLITVIVKSISVFISNQSLGVRLAKVRRNSTEETRSRGAPQVMSRKENRASGNSLAQKSRLVSKGIGSRPNMEKIRGCPALPRTMFGPLLARRLAFQLNPEAKRIKRIYQMRGRVKENQSEKRDSHRLKSV